MNTKLRDLKIVMTVVIIMFISFVINWYFVASQMNNKILMQITIFAHVLSILFLNYILGTMELATVRNTKLHQPLWFGFVIFVIIAAIMYLIEGNVHADTVLLANSCELVCITGLVLLFVIRFFKKREAERSKGEA